MVHEMVMKIKKWRRVRDTRESGDICIVNKMAKEPPWVRAALRFEEMRT